MEIQLLLYKKGCLFPLIKKKSLFATQKKPTLYRQLKCIKICKLIKNVVFAYKKTTTQQKCATYIPTLPQDKLKCNVHSSTTKKSHLTYDEKNSPMFVPNFTLNHITLHIILLPCNNIY